MKLHERPKGITRKAKRVGRGYGSGKGGHTTTRGQKGQKSRGKLPQWFTGTSWVWFKRLPMLRGKGKFKPTAGRTRIVRAEVLNVFRDGQSVTKEALVEKGLITDKEAKTYTIKVVEGETLEKKIKLDLKASKSVVTKLKKLGGEYLRETA